MNCPRDQSVLVDSFISGKLISRCPMCEGAFISRDVLRRLYEMITRTTPRILATREMDERTLHASGIDCPNDSTPMGLRTFMSVQLDVCSRCLGVWFDKGELQMVWAEYEPGYGPDVTAIEQDKEPTSLKEAVLIIPEAIRALVDGVLEFVADLAEARYRW